MPSPKNPPLLLTLTNNSIPGGVEVYARTLCKVILSLRVIGREDVSTNESVSFNILKEVGVASAQAQWVESKSTKPPLIFTSGLHGSKIDSRAENIPTVSISHGTFFGLADVSFSMWNPLYWRMKYIYAHFEKQSLANAHVRIANSKFTKDSVKKNYGLDSKVVEPPIDTKIFRPGSKTSARKKLNIPSGKKVVLFVGNPTYSKGWDIVEHLAESFHEYSFYAVCQPTIPSPRENLNIVPPQKHAELADYYRAADAVVFPSRYEGFGFVPLEALACHCPVIASRVGVLNDFSAKGSHIVPHTDEAFTQKVKEAMESNEKVSAHDQIAKRFSFENFSKGIHEAVDEAKKMAGKSK